MKIKLIVLFAFVFCIQGALCGVPARLPGRSITVKRLPATLRQFLVRHLAGLHHFAYRSDRRFYYACDEAGGYYLFCGEGTLRGFCLHMRQPTREIVDLLPEAVTARIRELYPNYFLCSFLPEGEGFRAELFGTDNRTLHFDGQGCLLGEE